MLADIYIPRLSSDMQVGVEKNHLGVKFCTEVWTLKTGVALYGFKNWSVNCIPIYLWQSNHGHGHSAYKVAR